MNAKFVVKTLWSWCKRHSTRLLAGGAILAEAWGFYFMHREAPVVKERLDNLDPDAKWYEKVKTSVPVYLPAIGMFIVSSACIVGGCIAGEAKTAMMAGLYSASAAELQKYKDKMIETVGEDKAQEIHNDIARDLEKKSPSSFDESMIEYTNHGGQLFYDPNTARFFTSTESYILKCVEKINSKIYGVDMWVSVNEFYDELGITHAKLADPFGWNIDHKLDVSFAPAKTDDGRYYGVLVYFNEPRLYNGELPKNIND